MKQLVTTAIVLTRTDYGEADRILTLLTPDQGKLRLLAKGVRRVKSKLAGGIELFSTSTITFIRGRGELGTLVSTRLVKHYGHIIKDIERTMLGYDLIKALHKATEDEPGAEYFELLQQAFEALDDESIPTGIINLWFSMQLVRLSGQTPNLQTDTTGQKLAEDKRYNFSFEGMAFVNGPDGQLTSRHIKFLRLGFSGHAPKVLAKVQGAIQLTQDSWPIIRVMSEQMAN